VGGDQLTRAENGASEALINQKAKGKRQIAKVHSEAKPFSDFSRPVVTEGK
jgi:hypothetical protein